jgi:hypothetical protein
MQSEQLFAVQPLTVDSLKRQATRLKKARGIRQHEALDLVIQEHGYVNWRHFLNSSASKAVTEATVPQHTAGEPPTFAQWLAKHINRDSPLGDLAQDAARDKGWPTEGNLETYRSHLSFHGAAFEARRTLNQAWKTYQAYVKRLAGSKRDKTPDKTVIKLTAHLLENGMIQAQLSGDAFVSPPPLSRPQHPDMLSLQLNNNVWVTDTQKEAFWKELLSKRIAEIILPRNSTKFFTV